MLYVMAVNMQPSYQHVLVKRQMNIEVIFVPLYTSQTMQALTISLQNHCQFCTAFSLEHLDFNACGDLSKYIVKRIGKSVLAHKAESLAGNKPSTWLLLGGG